MDASKRRWSILPVYISASRWFWSFWQGHCFFKNGVRTETVPFSPTASTGYNLSFLACHGQWPECLLLAMTPLFFAATQHCCLLWSLLPLSPQVHTMPWLLLQLLLLLSHLLQILTLAAFVSRSSCCWALLPQLLPSFQWPCLCMDHHDWTAATPAPAPAACAAAVTEQTGSFITWFP